MKSWGIRARVLFLALLPSIMILLTLAGYFTYARIAEVDVLLAQRGNSLARQLAPGTEFALFAGDSAALDRLAKAAVSEADVATRGNHRCAGTCRRRGHVAPFRWIAMLWRIRNRSWRRASRRRTFPSRWGKASRRRSSAKSR